MAERVSVVGAIVFAALLCFAILWFVRRAFIRHDPQRAAASVTVGANSAFELELPGSPGTLFFRFNITNDTDFDYDLLVSGDILDGLGNTRAFAVKTTRQSRIKGAGNARYAGTKYAVTNSTGSVSLTTVDGGDRIVRGVVTEHPNGLLRQGWIYIPSGT